MPAMDDTELLNVLNRIATGMEAAARHRDQIIFRINGLSSEIEDIARQIEMLDDEIGDM